MCCVTPTYRPCGGGYNWEVGEAPEDEGIQPDLQPVQPHQSSSTLLRFYPSLPGSSNSSGGADAASRDVGGDDGGDDTGGVGDRGGGSDTKLGGGGSDTKLGGDTVITEAGGVGGAGGDFGARGVDETTASGDAVVGGDSDTGVGVRGGGGGSAEVVSGGSVKSVVSRKGVSGGGSLQDIRRHMHHVQRDNRKTNSACNLGRISIIGELPIDTT